MELIRGLHNLRERHRGCVLTVGNFDGVHRGHQAVLSQLAAAGAAAGLPACVMTFEPQPREFFAPHGAPARLTRLREKLEVFAACGVDRVLVVRFDERLSRLAPHEFVERVLVAGLGARRIVIGDDFRFGHGGRGDFALLVERGARHGFEVVRRDTLRLDGERVSSSRVRDALGRGDLAAAERLLGRPYAMSGRVEAGDRRGRTLGFPTANVGLRRLRTPVTGVFAVEVDGAAPVAAPGMRLGTAPGMANVGTRPTVDGREWRLEVHLFDFAGDLYGRHLRVRFARRIRAERRFDSLDALAVQLARDAAAAREALGLSAGGAGATRGEGAR